jgi:hypothetical protein
MLNPLPESFPSVLSHIPEPALAVLRYSSGERSFDIALLIFSSIVFIAFAIVGIRGMRKEVRTEQTKRATFAVVVLGLFIILLITGILHLRP